MNEITIHAHYLTPNNNCHFKYLINSLQEGKTNLQNQ